jgi:hypothetical protein
MWVRIGVQPYLFSSQCGQVSSGSSGLIGGMFAF